MWRILVLSLISLSAFAGQPGIWQLATRVEHIKEPPSNAKPSCKWFGESRDLGAKYELSCYSTVSKLTTVSSGHLSWTVDRPLSQLKPGDRLKVNGVATNTGTPERGSNVTCSMAWNSFGFTTGKAAAPGSSASCPGELTIPKQGMKSNGELIKEASLIQRLEFGNGTGIERHLIYRWQPIQGQAADPASGEVGNFAGQWSYDAPNATVQATQQGTQVRLLITQRRWGVPGPHYEITGTVHGQTLTGQWHNIIRDFSAVHPALTRQFGDPRCTRGGAMTLELSGNGDSLRITSAEDPCGHGWIGLVLNRY